MPTHFEAPAMSTAVAEMDLAPENRNALSAGLSRLDRAQKIKMGLGAFGLLAIALGNPDFPLGSGQIRVAGEGRLQGLLQSQGRCNRKVCSGQQQNAAGYFFQA